MQRSSSHSNGYVPADFENEQILKLSIGGTRQIEVLKSTLCAVKNSKLHKMFKNKNQGQKFFVNRDGRSFEQMINFIRNDFKITKFDSAY